MRLPWSHLLLLTGYCAAMLSTSRPAVRSPLPSLRPRPLAVGRGGGLGGGGGLYLTGHLRCCAAPSVSSGARDL
jgi:hypothetical protein